LGESLGRWLRNAAVKGEYLNESGTGSAIFQSTTFRYVLAQFVDIHGAAKAKAVPVEHLDMVLTDGAGLPDSRSGDSEWGPRAPTTWPSADLSTLQAIPWMPGYARLICNGAVNMKPYP